MSGGNSEPGRSVLSKAFAILDALRDAQVDLTRAQLARRTGLPMTTVHRLAGELCEHGALEMTDRRTYRVGPWLWEIGMLSAHTRTLRHVAIPFMQDLYETTHENVQLAVPDGLDALIVERVRGRTSVPITSRVGGRLPMHATGVGKAILAYLPEETVEAVISPGPDADHALHHRERGHPARGAGRGARTGLRHDAHGDGSQLGLGRRPDPGRERGGHRGHLHHRGSQPCRRVTSRAADHGRSPRHQSKPGRPAPLTQA